ncbi:hypothetical protein [Microseira sp. BLCC-F43]|jgi:hypothetical protein|uniref:hypothetical protein n=1 Tax=Microseira sp. BLCC-F43 TaxID=3153602 RepID=UPI0035B8B90D
MNVTIKDIDILRSLEPEQVAAYLLSQGWQQHNHIPDKASIWQQNWAENELVQIILPLNREIPGDPVSMSVILETLEKTEKRSQLDIIGDLVTATNNMTIQATIVQIESPNSEALRGDIVLLGVVFDKLRKIKTSLAKRDYILAIKAYQERLPVVFQGDLIKQNNLFILQNIRYFALESGILG